MGKWNYDWEVVFYTSGNFLKTLHFRAKSREEALRKLHESGVVVLEVMRCRRTDKW